MADYSKKIYTHRERMMHQSWCLKNDIIIYFKAIDWRRGQIVIQENGKKYITEEIYIQPTEKHKLKAKDKRWWQEIFKLYTSKYLEHNK